MAAPTYPEPREVLYEFIRFGNSIRVNAVDPDTTLEVTVIGPLNSLEMLKRIARRKLGFVIAKQERRPPPPQTQSGWDR